MADRVEIEDRVDKTRGQPRVFVYGTLKQGQANDLYLMYFKMLHRDTVTIPGRFVSLGGFPGAVRGENDDEPVVIRGEVYAVDEDTLQAIDLLEGHPAFYERHKYRTDRFDTRVWMYSLPNTPRYEGYPSVPHGLWSPTEEERSYWFGERDDASTE